MCIPAHLLATRSVRKQEAHSQCTAGHTDPARPRNSRKVALWRPAGAVRSSATAENQTKQQSKQLGRTVGASKGGKFSQRMYLGECREAKKSVIKFGFMGVRVVKPADTK